MTNFCPDSLLIDLLDFGKCLIYWLLLHLKCLKEEMHTLLQWFNNLLIKLKSRKAYQKCGKYRMNIGIDGFQHCSHI